MFILTVLVPSEIEAEVLRDLNLDLNIIGIGPVESALSSYQILSEKRPKIAFLTGWAGAYPGTDLNIGDIVVATEEIFVDFGRKYETHFTSFPENFEICKSSLRHAFTERVIQLLESFNFNLLTGTFSTVCSATYDVKRAYYISKKYNAIAENMEGFGVARACERLKIQLIEIRVISNLLSQPERKWDKDKASHVLKEVWECIIKNWK